MLSTGSLRYLQLGIIFVLCFGLAIPLVMAAEGVQELINENFAQSAVGTPPTGWIISADPGHFQVVNDAGLASGKAVQILGNDKAYIEMRIGASTIRPIIVIEHAIRWVKNGSRLLFVVRAQKNAPNNVHWEIDANGKLLYWSDQGRQEVGPLKEGWNRIRVVANCNTDLADVYLNDMEKPLLNGVGFRAAVENWSQIAFLIADNGRQPVTGEAYIGDIKILATTDAELLSKAENMDTVVLGASLEVPDFISGTDRLDSIGLTVNTTQAVTDINIKVMAHVTPIQRGVHNDTTITLVDQVVDLQSGVNHFAFGISHWDIDYEADVRFEAIIGAASMESMPEIAVRGLWHEAGITLAAINAVKDNIVLEKPPSMAFEVQNQRQTPLAAQVTAEWVEANLPLSMLGFPYPKGVKGSVEIGKINMAPGDTVRLEIQLPPDIPMNIYAMNLRIKSADGSDEILFPVYPRILLGIPSHTAKSIQVVDGTLLINGKPTLLRGIGFYHFDRRSKEQWAQDMERYAALGLNTIQVFTVVGRARDFASILDAAAANGIYVIAHVATTRAGESEKMLTMPKESWLLSLAPYLEYWNHPNLIGWIVHDDTYFERHFTVANTLADFIRSYDNQSVITATLMDPRRLNLTDQQWVQWRTALDFPTAYWYPLLRDGRVTSQLVNSARGMRDFQALAERTKQAWNDNNVYQWTFVQAHTQGTDITNLGFSTNEHYTATPDQLRVLTYAALNSQIRGLLYFWADSLEDEYMGLGRRNELKLIWSLLQPVEEELAAGKRQVLSDSPANGLEIVSYDHDGNHVVLITKHGAKDYRHISTGSIPTQTIELAVEGQPQAYLLDNSGVTLLPSSISEGIMSIHVPALDLTGVILVTQDQARVEQIAAHVQSEQPATAQAALAVLTDTLVKVEAVQATLQGTPYCVDGTVVLQRAHAAFNKGIELLQAQRWAELFPVTRQAMEELRRLVEQQLLAADQHLQGQSSMQPFTRSYFALPRCVGRTLYAPDIIDQVKQLVARIP